MWPNPEEILNVKLFFKIPTFQKVLFFITANFRQLSSFFTVTLSIYHLVINPTNTWVLDFKIPGSAQSGAVLRKFFL